MNDLNPELVQPESWGSDNPPSSTTAVLIHDGGGTTFPYHCLGPLNRNIYGIWNPHFYSGDTFPGGLPQMAKLYADYIRDAVKSEDFRIRRKRDGSVDLLLGGWSLGGMLTLEVAKELADDKNINVVGMVLIDSPCLGSAGRHLFGTTRLKDFSEEGKSRNQILSNRAMAEAVRMTNTWDPPVWDGHLAGKRPKAVLIRARDRYPLGQGELSRVDVFRDDETLNWSTYDADMFIRVFEIPGHHFNIFDMPYIESTTNAVQDAFFELMQPPSKHRLQDRAL
ncbi:hypothetical protein ACO1O0_003652 [Amphichorda felina]